MSIEVKNVCKNFGKKEVLKDVSLKIERGKITGLIGLNGVGKTTLLKIIVGLSRPDSGTVSIDGQDPLSTEAKESFTFLPEQVRPSENLSGMDLISYLNKLHGDTITADRIENMCERLSFEKTFLKKSIRTYSKGMRQKIFLMATFLCNKPYLIMDEPLSGIDPSVRVILKDLILESKENGTGVLFSTHILADLEEMTDEIVVLHNKEVIFSGHASQMINETKENTLEKAFLKLIRSKQ